MALTLLLVTIGDFDRQKRLEDATISYLRSHNDLFRQYLVGLRLHISLLISSVIPRGVHT